MSNASSIIEVILRRACPSGVPGGLGGQQAELAADVSIDTWRMWRTVLTLPPGSHTLQVRATDTTGATQISTPSLTIPDGATAWHTVTVTAR